MPASDWLTVSRGDAPLVVSVPHAGTGIPGSLESRLASTWLARKDADWWLDRLYRFAEELGASVIRTGMCRTVVDVNRDPAGASLYPGRATTALCPLDTFDGEPLYVPGGEPVASEIADRRRRYFDPYHRALADEVSRLKRRHGYVVLYDCHSIRSVIPRLFDGELPQCNIGTDDGRSCDAGLTRMIEAHCDKAGLSRVTNGRFTGGYITRHYGRPAEAVHALQMELACRGYMREPDGAPTPANWPAPYLDALAAPLRATLRTMLDDVVRWSGPALAARKDPR